MCVRFLLCLTRDLKGIKKSVDFRYPQTLSDLQANYLLIDPHENMEQAVVPYLSCDQDILYSILQNIILVSCQGDQHKGSHFVAYNLYIYPMSAAYIVYLMQLLVLRWLHRRLPSNKLYLQ